MLTLNKQSTILTLEEERPMSTSVPMSKREEIMSKWKDYIVDMTQSVENMNGRLVMITDMTLLIQPIIDKLGAYDSETLYKEFGPFSIRYEYGGTLIEIHLKEIVNNL